MLSIIIITVLTIDKIKIHRIWQISAIYRNNHETVPLPLFRFSFVENSVTTDSIDCPLPSVAAAKCQAARTLGAMICDAGSTAWEGRDWNVSVSDETGLILFSLTVVPVDAPALHRPSALAAG